MRRVWSPEEDGNLRSLWASYVEIADVASVLKRSVGSVKGRVQKLHFLRPCPSRLFFDSWSHDMAYVLGLVVTDGNVSKNGRCVSIELKIEDVSVLEKIKTAMQLPGSIWIRKPCEKLRLTGKLAGKVVRSKGAGVLSVGRTHAVSRLAELGVHSKKSLREVFPPVPKEYLRDFLRGYFDGDGGCTSSVRSQGNYGLTFQVYFLGNMHLLAEIRGFLYCELGVGGGSIDEGRVCEEGSVLHQLTYGKEDGQAILDWFYSSPSLLFLDRKKLEYVTFLMAEPIDVARRHVLRQDQIRQIRKQGYADKCSRSAYKSLVLARKASKGKLCD